jgi:hypothetical protein
MDFISGDMEKDCLNAIVVEIVWYYCMDISCIEWTFFLVETKRV